MLHRFLDPTTRFRFSFALLCDLGHGCVWSDSTLGESNTRCSWGLGLVAKEDYAVHVSSRVVEMVKRT